MADAWLEVLEADNMDGNTVFTKGVMVRKDAKRGSNRNGESDIISNGSIMHPNAGYNMFGGELGLRYSPNGSAGPSRPMSTKQLHEEVDKPWAVEITSSKLIQTNTARDI